MHDTKIVSLPYSKIIGDVNESIKEKKEQMEINSIIKSVAIGIIIAVGLGLITVGVAGITFAVFFTPLAVVIPLLIGGAITVVLSLGGGFSSFVCLDRWNQTFKQVSFDDVIDRNSSVSKEDLLIALKETNNKYLDQWINKMDFDQLNDIQDIFPQDEFLKLIMNMSGVRFKFWEYILSLKSLEDKSLQNNEVKKLIDQFPSSKEIIGKRFNKKDEVVNLKIGSEEISISKEKICKLEYFKKLLINNFSDSNQEIYEIINNDNSTDEDHKTFKNLLLIISNQHVRITEENVFQLYRMANLYVADDKTLAYLEDQLIFLAEKKREDYKGKHSFQLNNPDWIKFYEIINEFSSKRLLDYLNNILSKTLYFDKETVSTYLELSGKLNLDFVRIASAKVIATYFFNNDFKDFQNIIGRLKKACENHNAKFPDLIKEHIIPKLHTYNLKIFYDSLEVIDDESIKQLCLEFITKNKEVIRNNGLWNIGEYPEEISKILFASE